MPTNNRGFIFRCNQYIHLCNEVHFFQNVLLARMVSIVNPAVIHVLATYVKHVMEIVHMVAEKASKEFVVIYQVY